ncbi:division/cell wall cluster transcriptional repressor MraZ [Kiritimatiella glycovorans]|uniref:Transcriptional regulator MraZ n=1 Tax=Kiritimatiella glycovorans TaxID=1307763 RepID=A0A0G3ELI6_9BACT|nr:division/cell wall cluster transcriptional repressor MraZ [Kiritimatiella glycovorans]AKJ65004.1 cell division protein MraZ [Kiritimatiella glycovorans]
MDGMEQGVFVGTYRHALDPKRRLTIPSEWRALMAETNRVYVIPGIEERCLYVYTAQEMTRRMQKVRDLSVADEKARTLLRQVASQASSAVWDSQGRIRINDALLEHAGIEAQVVLSGAFFRFEVWSPGEFDRVSRESAEGGLAEAARYAGF